MGDDGDDCRPTTPAPPPKRLRGFAILKARGIDFSATSRRGGIAVHAAGTGHQWTREEARAAGKLGSAATWGKPTPQD
jgi:hypothetical protein